MHFIFDLDHTVIDSSHRQITRPDGSLDLAAWIKNNTRANIMRDTLLPLAAQWRLADKKGATIVICTARVMGAHDFDFLASHMAYGGTLAFPARWETHYRTRNSRKLCSANMPRLGLCHGRDSALHQSFLMITNRCSQCLTGSALGLIILFLSINR